MIQPPTAGGVPGQQHLTGYRMRDYDQLMATLARSRESQRITNAQVAARIGDHEANIHRSLSGRNEVKARRLFALVHALGYDLALIPGRTRD